MSSSDKTRYPKAPIPADVTRPANRLLPNEETAPSSIDDDEDYPTIIDPGSSAMDATRPPFRAPEVMPAPAPASDGSGNDLDGIDPDRFRDIRLIGQGGFADVFRAYDNVLARNVALKRLNDSARSSPELLARFRQEAQVPGRVKHAAVLEVYDIIETASNAVIIMELWPGRNLHEEVRALGRLQEKDAAMMFAVLADGLAAVHAGKVIHRDIKPQNILVSSDGRPKFTDFGIARVDGASMVRTSQWDVFGSPFYMAPELRTSASAATAASDIYALGLTLYYATTGHEAEAFETEKAPGDIQKIVDRCAQTDPNKRFASAEEMAQALWKITEKSGSEGPSFRLLVVALVALVAVALSVAKVVSDVSEEEAPTVIPPTATAESSPPQTRPGGERPASGAAAPSSAQARGAASTGTANRVQTAPPAARKDPPGRTEPRAGVAETERTGGSSASGAPTVGAAGARSAAEPAAAAARNIGASAASERARAAADSPPPLELPENDDAGGRTVVRSIPTLTREAQLAIDASQRGTNVDKTWEALELLDQILRQDAKNVWALEKRGKLQDRPAVRKLKRKARQAFIDAISAKNGPDRQTRLREAQRRLLLVDRNDALHRLPQK